MKKICLFLIFTGLFTGYTYAQDVDNEQIQQDLQPKEQQEIILNTGASQKSYNTGKNKYNSNSKIMYSKEHQQDITDYSKTNPNQKKSVTTDYKKKVKDVTLGSKTTHTTTSDTYSGSNTMYAEYEKNNFKLNSGYTRNSTPTQENSDKGSVSVTPEYKLNKHVSVQNKYSTNMNDNSKQAEVRLNVQPLKDDRMNMGVGVGQKFSGTSAPNSSQVNFSTNFKF